MVLKACLDMIMGVGSPRAVLWLAGCCQSKGEGHRVCAMFMPVYRQLQMFGRLLLMYCDGRRVCVLGDRREGTYVVVVKMGGAVSQSVVVGVSVEQPCLRLVRGTGVERAESCKT